MDYLQWLEPSIAAGVDRACLEVELASESSKIKIIEILKKFENHVDVEGRKQLALLEELVHNNMVDGVDKAYRIGFTQGIELFLKSNTMKKNG